MACRDRTNVHRAGWRLAIALFAFFMAMAEASELPPGVRIDAQIEPAVIGPGQVAELAITITVPPGWIVYDLEQTANSVQPTRITLDRSEDFSPLDGYQAPPVLATRDPAFQNRIVRYFAQSPTFRRPLVFSARAESGRKPISGRIDFQLHDPATGKYLLVRKAAFATSVDLRAEPGPLPAGEAAVLPVALPNEADIAPAEMPAAAPPAPPGPPAPSPPPESPPSAAPPAPPVAPPASPVPRVAEGPEPSVADVVSVVEVRPGELDLLLGDSRPGTRRFASDRDGISPATPLLVFCVFVGLVLGLSMAALRRLPGRWTAGQAAARWVTMLWRRAR